MSDKFTSFSLVIVGVIFAVALQMYLADISAALPSRVLSFLIPAVLLAVYAIGAARQSRRPKA